MLRDLFSFKVNSKKIYENFSYQNEWGNNIKGGTYYYLLTIPNGQTCKGWLEVIN